MTKGGQKGKRCDKEATAGSHLCSFHRSLQDKVPKNPCESFECAVDPVTLRALDGFIFDEKDVPAETLSFLARTHGRGC